MDNNTAEGGHSWNGVDSSAYGGGLFAGSTSFVPISLATVVTLSNATLDGNTATLEGQGDGTLVSVGYVSGAYGGGACLSTLGTGTATLTNCTVQGNSAVGGIDTSRGGGLYILSTATLTNCTVQGNSAEGGPANNYPPEGGGLFVSGIETKVTLVNDTVQGNSTQQFNGYGGYSNYDYGGGIYIAAASTSASLGYTVYLDSFTVANTINNIDSTGHGNAGHRDDDGVRRWLGHVDVATAGVREALAARRDVAMSRPKRNAGRRRRLRRRQLRPNQGDQADQ